MPVPVMMHGHGGHRGCPLAYATYRTSSHPVELWTTSWVRGPISGLSSWGDVLDPSTGHLVMTMVVVTSTIGHLEDDHGDGLHDTGGYTVHRVWHTARRHLDV